MEKESLTINEGFPETGGDTVENEVAIPKSSGIAEDKKERDVSVFEANKNFAKERIELSTQNNLTLKIGEIGTVAEDLKYTEEKNAVIEKRRIQDELLEREQREREMRRAKLASIMSRTRGSAPSVVVVPPALHIESSDVISFRLFYCPFLEKN